MNSGQLCADQSAPIIDENQCNEAIITVQSKYSRANNVAVTQLVNLADHPQGCYLNTNNWYMYWNKHKTGSRNGRDIPVCRGKGKKKLLSNENYYRNIG